MKYRICRHYSPMVGTWYVIQKKVLFWWRTLPLAFNDLIAADEIFSKLMGDEVEPRREFIEQNAVYVENLDI